MVSLLFSASLLAQHRDDEFFPCPYCLRPFADFEALQVHALTACPKNPDVAGKEGGSESKAKDSDVAGFMI